MSDHAFRTQLASLREVFSENLFAIPDYQRNYSWGEKQVRDLLEDIESMIGVELDGMHYTGTLVLTKSERRVGAYDVIDGQQRLTTLSILANSMARIAEDKPTKSDLIQTYVFRGGRGDELDVIEVQSDCREYFREVVMRYRDEALHDELDAHSRLLQARNEIDRWIEAQRENGTTAEEIRKVVERRLGFLVFAPDNSADAGTMFEVINNRGKALSELEKIKNYLVYSCAKLDASNTRKQIDTAWTRIQKNLSLAGKVRRGEESAFVRYCLIVFAGLSKQESQSGYQEIKRIASLDKALRDKRKRDNLLSWIEGLLDFLETASLWYARLHGVHDKNIPSELVSPLELLRAQSRHASIAPLFLAICVKSTCTNTKKLRLLQLLEILNFRVYLARGITKRNDSGQAALFGVAQAYYASRCIDHLVREWGEDVGESVTSEEDALEFYLVWFALDYATDEVFRRSFELQPGDNEDFYRWTGLRYFLYCYEQHLRVEQTVSVGRILGGRAKSKTGDYLSVEHLWGTRNYGVTGRNTRGCDRLEKRRLGNFVLLDLRSNIQGTDENLEDKLPWYRDGGSERNPTDLKQVREVSGDLQKAKAMVDPEYERRGPNYDYELHRIINDARECRMIKFACNRWSLKEFLGYQEVVDSWG